MDKLTNLVTTLCTELTCTKKTIGQELADVKSSIANFSTLTHAKNSDGLISSDKRPVSLPSVWSDKENVSKIKSSLVVKNKDESCSSDKVADMNKLKSIAVSNNIAVSRVGFDRSGNTYIDCPTVQDITKLKPLIAADFVEKHVTEVKEKLPCISIVGIQDEVTKNNLLTQICKQNSKIHALINAGEQFSVLFVKSSPNNGSYMAVVRVSPKIRNAIRCVRNQVFLGITSCRVYDRFYIKRCNQCQEYGHYKAECVKPACCAYCGGGHESSVCDLKDNVNSDQLSCINCKKGGKEHSGHTTFAFNCPSYLAAQKKLKSTIPYYDKSVMHQGLNT